MTEDEAKTKWCCGPKIIADQQYLAYIGDQPAPATANALCIASACMAWRSGINKFHDLDRGVDVEEPYGYCGLAGKP